MPSLIVILRDQLSINISSLKKATMDDVLFMCEAMEDFSNVPHHPKKIAFIISSMRHFAKDLRELGYNLNYIKLEDKTNSGNVKSEILRALREKRLTSITITEPSEWHTRQIIEELSNSGIEINLLKDDRFLSDKEEFKTWADGKKQLRMEFFYRLMRKKHKILLDSNNNPIGGKWNYDAFDRESSIPDLPIFPRIKHDLDEISVDVIEMVKRLFSHHFGDILPFDFAINRREATKEAVHFIKHYLPYFGQYQDLMLHDEALLYHSGLSQYLNVGLLQPLELCKMAEESYKNNLSSLYSTEGFIRQILGWREYIRGIYWYFMPKYSTMNYLEAQRTLPPMYWGYNTQMSCIREVVKQTKKHAYSHHIQRLMITGNFALLSGINPRLVEEWYLGVYADAFDWVELPNTLGMSLFGDGGIVASKPYAASANYINKMSNFCSKCAYNPHTTLNKDSCPFNSLYWNFIIKHRHKFIKNPRMAYPLATENKFSAEYKELIMAKAEDVMKKSDDGTL